MSKLSWGDALKGGHLSLVIGRALKSGLRGARCEVRGAGLVSGLVVSGSVGQRSVGQSLVGQ